MILDYSLADRKTYAHFIAFGRIERAKEFLGHNQIKPAEAALKPFVLRKENLGLHDQLAVRCESAFYRCGVETIFEETLEPARRKDFASRMPTSPTHGSAPGACEASTRQGAALI
ncbi:hypothetical protein [Mesorhizobium sp. M0816]|uniref:hypothetical protein n=1 Tax=Mesorhizobium sp. M0816 TaxID=2957006 RepID=UPI00333B64FD